MPQLTADEQTALVESLAKQRLRRFRAATSGDRDAVSLYLLDSEIAANLHAAVRFAEVALREAIHRAMSAHYGQRWFQDHRDLLDITADEAFTDAETAVGQKAPAGKIIAQVMLGTWVSLLGRGDSKPDGTRAYYVQDLWEPALKKGFSMPRSDLRSLAMRVNWARNRISHCEPVIFGLPMPGLGQPGIQIRRSPALILNDSRDLLRASSANFADWFDRWETTRALMIHPLSLDALDHIAEESSIELQR